MSTRLAVALVALSALCAGTALAVSVLAFTRDDARPVAASGPSVLCTDALTRRQNAQTVLSTGLPANGNGNAWAAARDDARRHLADAQNDINRYC